jgi:hypothetical protein
MRYPKAVTLLNYEQVYNEKPPEDRVSIIENLPGEFVLFVLAGINYRLKPIDKVSIDSSLNTQIKELQRFFPDPSLYAKYAYHAELRSQSKEDFPIIFHRHACLFGIEEVINSSKIKMTFPFDVTSPHAWETIFKYLLAVNFVISRDKVIVTPGKLRLEEVNSRLIHLNEISIETDQIFTPYRGYWLIRHFLENPKYFTELTDYFNQAYGIEPERHITEILKHLYANTKAQDGFNFFYQVAKGDQDFIERLSNRSTQLDPFKMISVRKWPFIKIRNFKYLLTDSMFLIEKCYDQLVNDFWFDHLRWLKDEKGLDRFTFKDYRAEVGLFLESYLTTLLKESFKNYKYSKLLMFKDLIVYPRKGVKYEIADVYLRSGNKILLAEVKSSSIYDPQKHGGDLESLYKNDRAEFFKNLGVNQIVKSIVLMDSYINSLDERYPQRHSIEVYPCIIVHDKALQVPLMANTFNERFQELRKDINIKKLKIKPLTLIHINDLERLEGYLTLNPSYIWFLLKENIKHKEFIPPFFSTVNKYWREKKYAKRTLSIFKNEIIKETVR